MTTPTNKIRMAKRNFISELSCLWQGFFDRITGFTGFLSPIIQENTEATEKL